MPKIVIGLGGLGSAKSIKETLAKQVGTENHKNSDFIIINSDDEDASPSDNGENMDEYALDELIHSYMDGEIEFDEVLDFCDALEPTAENKEMLIDAITSFDIMELYETLFGKFNHLLTDEERAFYRERYKKVFG